MFTALKQPKLVALWGLVPLIAIVEIASQWSISRSVPTSRDWQAAAAAVREKKGAHDIVIIAPDWATQGRMYLGDLITERDFGRFDVSTYDRIFEVSVNGARADETRYATPLSTRTFGDLSVSEYKRPARRRVTYVFQDHLDSATTTLNTMPTVGLAIDHAFQPRQVIQIPLKPRRSTLTFENVPMDGVLYGYGVITVRDYRASVYDADDPVILDVFVNDSRKKSLTVANFAGPRRFEVDLPGSGTGTVRFEIRSETARNRGLGLVADIRNRGKSR
jgi:hypothetical protein